MKPLARHARRLAVVLLPLLAATGCYDDDTVYDTGVPASCSVADQNVWLDGYMNDWYFWYQYAPRPDPGAYSSVDSYFSALLYTGTNASFPADRWSFMQTTEAFTRLFGDGQALGYGVAVAGIEVQGNPTAPLYVRYVDPGSPAAVQGVVRGDQVISINGRAASDVIAADDYSALGAASTGETLTLVLANGGVQRTLTLSSAVYDLAPVTGATVVTTPQGRKMGYVLVKDMISQVQAPLETAFAQFKAAGVSEIVLDLRYNGGGLVSVGSLVASYVAGTRGEGHTYAALLYNDKRAADYNQRFYFASGVGSAANVPRVFVLTGPRTCSASEQVVNGLRGIGVDVVTVGDTSCGKPVGFLPVSACGTTFDVVNFESVNELDQGRYFDGFSATCPTSEDFTQPLGSGSDPLLAAAASYADSGACPATSALGLKQREARTRRRVEAGQWQGMIGR